MSGIGALPTKSEVFLLACQLQSFSMLETEKTLSVI
jgi:hypothetical protein